MFCVMGDGLAVEWNPGGLNGQDHSKKRGTLAREPFTSKFKHDNDEKHKRPTFEWFDLLLVCLQS